MQHRFQIPTLLLAICLGGWLAPADADTVVLNNGDRLTGSVTLKQGDILELKTGYAGTIKINWTEVKQVISDRPVKIILSDDTRLTGTLLPTEAGKIRIKAGAIVETAPIDLQQVRYINPPVEVTGGVRFKGKVNVGINIASGNTNTKDYHLDTEVVARTLENRYTLGATYNRAKDSGRETENNATGYGKYDHFLDKKWYLYANTLFERDKFKDLKLRTTLGVGSGYQFYESDKTNLSLEGGLNYVNEDFYTKTDDSFPAGRWAVNFDHLLFDTKYQLFHFQEGYLGLKDTSDVFIRTKTGLRLPLSSSMAATAEYDYDWDNKPAPGSKRADSRYLINLGYHW